MDFKTEVGTLGFNFLLLKRKGFYCTLNRIVSLSQPQPRKNPLGRGPRGCAAHAGGWLYWNESRD